MTNEELHLKKELSKTTLEKEKFVKILLEKILSLTSEPDIGNLNELFLTNNELQIKHKMFTNYKFVITDINIELCLKHIPLSLEDDCIKNRSITYSIAEQGEKQSCHHMPKIHELLSKAEIDMNEIVDALEIAKTSFTPAAIEKSKTFNFEKKQRRKKSDEMIEAGKSKVKRSTTLQQEIDE